jgi:YD repeat-containing protein
MMPFGMSPEATIDYDELGRMVHAKDPKTQREVWWAYDEEGRLSQTTETRPAAEWKTLCYDYSDEEAGSGEQGAEQEVGVRRRHKPRKTRNTRKKDRKG